MLPHIHWGSQIHEPGTPMESHGIAWNPVLLRPVFERDQKKIGLQPLLQVDLPILFQDKEPLLEGETLTVQSRTAVPTDFSSGEDWSWRLRQCPDFDPRQPTVWLLEGLMMRPGGC